MAQSRKQQKGTINAFKNLQDQRRKSLGMSPVASKAPSAMSKVGSTVSGAAKAVAGAGDKALNTITKPIVNAIVPKFKKGGKVKKTGIALVHKGEQVIPAKTAKKIRKSGGFNTRKYEATRRSVFGLGKKK